MTNAPQDVVSLNAIPYGDSETCFTRLNNRHKLREDIEREANNFSLVEHNFTPMHTHSVMNTKESLKALMTACKSYASNLGWEL
jgi:hypothetical protein